MKVYLMVMICFSIMSCSSVTGHEHQQTTGASLIGGSFEMEDHLGNKVTEKKLLGKYSLLFFGFTSCPTVCPMGLSTMGRVLHRLPKHLSKQIVPVFITVDPERDTGAIMQKYSKSFAPNFLTLRGNLNNTEKMVKRYRGYYKKVVEDGEDDYLIDHSDIIYFMSAEGNYIAHFSSATGVDNIVKKITKYMH